MKNVRIGMNSRLDTVQAAILPGKTEGLPDERAAVNRAAVEYSPVCQDLVKTPVVPAGFMSACQYTVRLDNRSDAMDCRNTLKGKGIPSMVYYPVPMHRQTGVPHHRICLRRIVRLPIGYARQSCHCRCIRICHWMK